MRTYARVPNGAGGLTWAEVNTASTGDNSAVWLTTLCQCLLLNSGESPFYSQYGIPAQQSVLQQIFPDFYVTQTQSQFARYFASLLVSRQPNARSPVYNVNIITLAGAKLQAASSSASGNILLDSAGNILTDSSGNTMTGSP